MIGLPKLVAVLGIVEEIGEVRKQVQVVGDAERGELRAGVVLRALPVDGAL